MALKDKSLGTMKPLGGGDPVPLLKSELVVGRRPSCDIILDFENVSGKHCKLRFLNQVWNIRDLGSTNGTRVNGQLLSSEHTVLPDDEISIASHIFTIDYEPGAPTSVLQTRDFADEEIAEAPRRHSLMELAGLDTDEDRKRHHRPTKPPETIERLSADEAEFDDVLPEHVKAAPAPVIDTTDDDFLKMIQDDVEGKKKPGKP